MTSVRRRLEPGRSAGEGGFTMVELVVAMSVAMVLMAVSMSVVVASQSAVLTTQQSQNLNEEARQAINRIARDVRQASRIVTAVNPDGPVFSSGSLVAVRFVADFDADGCTGGGPSPCLPYNPANPEDVTYCFQPATAQLYVIDNGASGVVPVNASTTSCIGGQPLLAGNVVALKVEYRSNLYRYDLNPSDGVTTWRELDEALPPTGDGNGVLDTELANVDSVVINITMRLGGRSQVYRTQVDLRNSS